MNGTSNYLHCIGYNYHGVEIVKRPDDVVDSSCGEQVTIECVAKALEQKILLVSNFYILMKVIQENILF